MTDTTDQISPAHSLPSIFDDMDKLLAYYSIQAEDFRMRHTAIWTEVKHYTWVLSIILGAVPVAVFGKTAIDQNDLYLLLMLPIFGFFIALIAFLIIRSDFVYYTQADSRLLYLEKMLGVTGRDAYVDNRLKRAVPEEFCVSDDTIRQSKVGIRSVIDLRIRGLILTTFILYAAASIFEIFYFYWMSKCL